MNKIEVLNSTTDKNVKVLFEKTNNLYDFEIAINDDTMIFVVYNGRTKKIVSTNVVIQDEMGNLKRPGKESINNGKKGKGSLHRRSTKS